MESESAKQVVVILPFCGRQVLLQLRDEGKPIPHPGHWAFFSGSIEPPESPRDCAARELQEELGLHPEGLRGIGKDEVLIGDLLHVHSFAIPLKEPLENLCLQEGTDLAFFSLGDLYQESHFSARTGKWHPLVRHPFIPEIVARLFDGEDRFR